MEFLNTLPFDSGEMGEDDWTKYVRCVLWVCGRDGLSTDEQSAIKAWLAEHNAPVSVYDAATSMEDSVEDIVGDGVLKTIAGPYLVRDSIRLAKVDGLSDVEMQAIYHLGDQVGLGKEKVDAVRDSIEAYEAAGRHWQTATS